MRRSNFLAFVWLTSIALVGFSWHSLRADNPKPVAHWEFGTEETSRIQYAGAIQRDVAGPRPPTFPDFTEHNTALKFYGDGARGVLDDSGDSSPFDFNNGDTIAIEAWVLADGIGENENRYVIGKGRTHRKGHDHDNQNWALRITGRKGAGHLSFLFATPRSAGDEQSKTGSNTKSDSHWHRWTSSDGFQTDTGWHYLAVSYQFGKPDSIRGWIDGVRLEGKWDMGGATSQSPVVDDDQVWIGSSMGGSSASSFHGSMDSIAVYREALTDEFVKSRFRREGPALASVRAPERMPELGVLPAGLVHFSAHEGMPIHTRWLNEGEEVPPRTMQWTEDSYFLTRLPYRYDGTGVRDGWKTPVLLRMAADVKLHAGENRLLLRSRGLSRLWFDGKVVARTTVLSGSTDGHQPVKPIAKPPLPGLQSAGYEMQEVIQSIHVPSDGVYRVILESMLGGKKFRAVPGEMCVAIQTDDGKSFVLLQANGSNAKQIHLTEEQMRQAATKLEYQLQELDIDNRRQLAKSQAQFWSNRHAIAKRYAIAHPAPQPVSNAVNPIDAFLTDRIEQAKTQQRSVSSEAAKHFQEMILPILNDHCIRCHGKKEAGGLRLDDPERAFRGGDSGEKAIVPGSSHTSQLIRRIRSSDSDERMPPGDRRLTKDQIELLEAWIEKGAEWSLQLPSPESMEFQPLVNDEAFLRRITLDTIGLPPTPEEITNFVADQRSDKRERAIDRLLSDPRWADHWVSYWQEVLAENPNMLKPSLNNSGPFRWYLHEAFLDGKPMDQMVSELILLKGSEREGGAAGFGLAADNDAPFAAKAHIIGTAFLGVELQCARCHDSPYHSTKQKDLYSMAAMLERKPIKVPKSSTVPAGFFEKKERESLIKVTLAPNETIEPSFPFSELLETHNAASIDELVADSSDSRERLAAIVTAPMNRRFAQVIVNRVWRRFIGAGIVEPPHDWEGQLASHPAMLEWLATDWIANGYDLKHLSRLIFTSQLYQREARGTNLEAPPSLRFFVAPERRRLSAEQVVDSMFAASGVPIDVEEITFDPEGRRAPDVMTTLGKPSRAWMFASISNERDRPSLSLPKAQAVNDVLEAFGWSGSRQNPRTDRETSPNLLHSGIMANSVVSTWVTRATYKSPLAEIALQSQSPDAIVETIFLRFLGRKPGAEERSIFVPALAAGFSTRRIPDEKVQWPQPLERLAPVTWSNHLVEEANAIQLQVEKRARAGDPADPRIDPVWRESYEDFVWSVMNTREFVWVP